MSTNTKTKYTITSEDGKHTVSRQLTDKQVKELSSLGYRLTEFTPRSLRGTLIADWEERVSRGMKNQLGSPTVMDAKVAHVGNKWSGNRKAAPASFHTLVKVKTDTATYLIPREQWAGQK